MCVLANSSSHGGSRLLLQEHLTLFSISVAVIFEDIILILGRAASQRIMSIVFWLKIKCIVEDPSNRIEYGMGGPRAHIVPVICWIE